MSRHRWLIAGLVAALLLFATGGLLGYRLGTSSDEEHRLWRLETEQLLDSLALEHQKDIRAMRDSVAGDTLARAAAEERARRAAALARDSRAEADTLRAELALAAHYLDSLRIYPALVSSLDSAVSRETLRGDQLQLALDSEKRSTARLIRMVGTQEAIIGQLTEQLTRLPKPARRGVRLLGISVAPCAYAGVGTQGADVGVGVCASR